MLLPYAALPGPVFPGFLLLNQTALLLAYGLGAWLLYVQFHRERTLSLLLAASASLFTAALIAAQTASFPGVFGPGTVRLIGHDAGTSSWFWVFWHAGPVLLGLSYAATVRRDRDADFRPGRTLLAAWLSVAGTLLLAVAFSAASVAWLRWLPPGSRGDDYSVLVTSGIGPGLVLFTVAALAAVWRATRAGRTVLELWIAVSLVLLTLDAILTQAGLTRGSVGCYAGRIGALFSAVAVLWAYLHEVKAAYPRAEKAAVAEVLRFEASLRQSQKMEAIGHLTSGIAHDFNNLLTVMTSAFTLIQRRPNDPAQVQQMAEAGLKAVARGSSLASQLLSFSRHKVPHLTVVNLNAVLIDFEAIAVRAIPISMDLEWHLAPELPEVKLDTADFETAVLNLVVNARDVMAAAGHTTEDTAEGRIVVADAGSRAGRGHLARRRPYGGPAAAAGRLRGRVGQRRWARHAERGGAAGIQSILYDQGSRQGHRFGTEPSLSVRPFGQRARRYTARHARHHGRAVAAAGGLGRRRDAGGLPLLRGGEGVFRHPCEKPLTPVHS